jgi:hypothetical protein
MNKLEFHRRKALHHHSKMEVNEELLKLAAAKPGSTPLVLNMSKDRFGVLVVPTLEEIDSVIAECERRWLDHIWTNFIISDPDKALASRGPATSVLKEYLLRRLGVKQISKSAAFQGIQFSQTPLPASREDRIKLLGPAPRNAAEALKIFPINFWLKRVKMAGLRPSDAGIDDSVTWLHAFFGLLRHNRAARFSTAYLRMVACQLVEHGWVLFPLQVAKSLEGGLYGEDRGNDNHVYSLYYSKTQRRRLDLLSTEVDDVADRAFARVCVFCTTFSDPAEVSWEYSTTLFRMYRTALKTKAAPKAWARLKEMARANGGEALAARYQDPFTQKVAEFCEASCKDMQSWRAALEGYRPTLNVKAVAGKFELLKFLLHWVLSFEFPPAPTEITRKHIRDDLNPSSNTLRRFLVEYRVRSSKGESPLQMSRRTAVMSEADRFFEWLADIERTKNPRTAFSNPIKLEQDKFRAPSGTRPESTYRDRLPAYIMAELQRLLVVRLPNGSFTWAEWLKEASQLRVGMDAELRFCPIYPAIIYLMLRFPLRTHQIRELDSGELDAMLYDFKTRTFRPNPGGIAGREAGVLIASSYATTAATPTQLDFQVFTNKRLVEQARRAAYSIPFVDDEIEWVIGSVLDWQKLWGAKPTLVNLADDPDGKTVTSQDQLVREHLPEICALFRHPEMRGVFAPRHSMIRTFWDKLCTYFDEQNRAWVDSKTGKIGRPDVPELSELRTYASHGTKSGTFTRPYAKFDLHSLRVAGVSALIDLGVPLAAVAAIAGHGSWVMTLHYYKHDKTTTRALLCEVLKDGRLQAHLEAIQEKLAESKLWDDLLMGSKAAIEKLKRTGKLYTLTATGICPGASCADGLPVGNRGFSMHVPGSRCELCQFRVYGPAFLPGLIQQLNLLVYTITEAGKKQREIREQLDAAYASDRRDAIVELRSLDEELEREMELDIAHLARTTEIVRECQAALQSGNPNMLISLSDKEQIALVMEPVREFEQLRDIILSAEFVKTKSRIPDDALLKMKDKLITLLVRNGAQPFLAGLPKDLSKKATLLFADILQRSIPETDNLEKLFGGEIALHALPSAEEPVLKAAALLAENLSDETKHATFTANPMLMLNQAARRQADSLL